MTTRIVELQLPPAEAWERVKSAASSIGKVEEAHERSRFLIFKSRYGLNPVRLRVSVLTGAPPTTALLDVQRARAGHLGRRRPEGHRPALCGDLIDEAVPNRSPGPSVLVLSSADA
jgi:hypothetical protein